MVPTVSSAREAMPDLLRHADKHRASSARRLAPYAKIIFGCPPAPLIQTKLIAASGTLVRAKGSPLGRIRRSDDETPMLLATSRPQSAVGSARHWWACRVDWPRSVYNLSTASICI